MTYQQRVLGVRFDVEASEPEDAERAEKWLSDLLGEQQTADDLSGALRTIARDAPTVRAWVLHEGEELDLGLDVVNGTVTSWSVMRAGNGSWVIDGQLELGAIATELARTPFVRTGTAKYRKPSEEKARFAKAERDAREAIKANDFSQLAACLTATGLAGTRGVDVRLDLVRGLLACGAPESGQILLDVLRREVPEIAHLVAYRLYTKKTLAQGVVDELLTAWKARPRTDVLVARLASAIAEWPDFPFPAGFLEAEPELRRLLDRRFAEAQPKPKVAQIVGSTLEFLEVGAIRGFRRARSRLTEVKPETRANLRIEFGERLHAVARQGDPIVRGAALDLLCAMGVATSKLGALTEGLGEAAGVRALRLASAPVELPIAPVVATVGPGAMYNWKDVLGVARYPGGHLVVNKKSTVSFEQNSKATWRATGFDGSSPLAVIGEPGPRVLLGSKHGVHALDRESGREIWCAGTVDPPSMMGLGLITDPRATVWAADDRHLLVMGTHHVTWLDARTGAVLDVAEIPFADPRGLMRIEGEDAVIVLDGTAVMNGHGNDDYLASGLVVRMDNARSGHFDEGSLEDRIVPRTLGAVVRVAGAVSAEFSPVDVVLTENRRRVHFLLPNNIVRIGPAYTSTAIGGACVLLFQGDEQSGFNGKWLSMAMSVD